MKKVAGWSNKKIGLFRNNSYIIYVNIIIIPFVVVTTAALSVAAFFLNISQKVFSRLCKKCCSTL